MIPADIWLTFALFPFCCALPLTPLWKCTQRHVFMSACMPAQVLVSTCVLSAHNVPVLEENWTLSQLTTPQLMNAADIYMICVQASLKLGTAGALLT